MAERLVLDASAAIARVLGEPAAPAVSDAIRGQGSDGAILVPDHFWLEVVNVLVRRYGVAIDDVITVIRELDELDIRTVEIDRGLLLLALDRMAVHGLTAYDAAYLALAQAVDGRLLTLDGRLASAAGARAVPMPGDHTRTSESPGTYDAAPIAVWARHGAYLAELRRKTA
jgi:predicted nucleic acid-binding protein